MEPARRHAYNLPRSGVVIGAGLWATFSAFLAFLAVATDRDATDGEISFCFVIFSGMFGCLAVFLLVRRRLFPRVLELAEDAILLPHGFLKPRITRIPYGDIIRMSQIFFRNQESLYITTAKGNFEIGASRFPNIESFRKVRDFVCARTSTVMPERVARKIPMMLIWGPFFPEPILRWKEPEEWARYRTHLYTSRPLLARFRKLLWFFVRCLGIIFAPWFLLRCLGVYGMPKETTADGYPWLGIVVTFFFTSLYWRSSKYPVGSNEISFRDNGLTYTNGKQFADWGYRDISGWSMIERPFEGHVLHILLLKARADVAAFALPDTNIRDRLVQLLHDKKIPQSPDLMPSWESRR